MIQVFYDGFGALYGYLHDGGVGGSFWSKCEEEDMNHIEQAVEMSYHDAPKSYIPMSSMTETRCLLDAKGVKRDSFLEKIEKTTWD